ncbi:MAG: TRAP dicarboxylate transporter, DctM subunit [Thermotoga sp. 50_1627]|uniref:TRAP transporter large permease n=1 Tax=Pseudothermotoga sp. TaxID=2033661 RepID=UPI00076C1648|nr:MAG: TRAP dicarboxylate transporter, DctM subunit [Thermotoga sp. 50_64]KUK25504.1 MAG: TRAP dicarboxylate transporter, DctM subunit [Thermotoga sp. 50_1627]MBC7115778.1 TRAP transporter large permease subunit [Pseudothermotoga sp.]MDK2924092.1 TRAP-type transport system large permease protein [Pseudothermotoga sp.]HBT38956.1 C4-dicarboxylate ABC transporter [Pseudothermotoga sp.]
MVWMLIAFLVFMLLGMPIAFAIGIAGFIWFLQHSYLPITIPIQMALSQIINFTLLAIPMFIIAGSVMNSAGVTKRLLDFASSLVGHMRGGLGQVSAVLSTLMGGVSGSSIADAAMETRMLGPEMLKRGYPRGFAVAVNVWTSLIVPIIPPGIAFILYGTIGQVSIGRLFAAGIMPGLLLMVVYMFVIHFVAKRLGLQPEREKRASSRDIARALSESIWALIFPVLLILGLRTGIFTPSEVGSFAVIYGIIVGFFIHKEMNLKQFFTETLENALGDIGAVLAILAMSNIFSYGMVWERVPEKLASFLLGISNNPYVLMIIIMVFLIFAGLFIDATALILMTTSVLLPVARKLGIDPVHFGLIFILSAAMGNQTPPVGASMYAGCSVLGASLEEYTKASWPFLLVTIIAILLIIFFPQLSLFIPKLIFG